MSIWEQVILGIIATAVLFLFWPGAKRMLEKSRQAEDPDWKGALIPIGMVVLFIILLILVTKSG